MRIATWNVNSLTARLPRVEEWIRYAQPDVLCLQETKQADAAFPHGAFAALGYDAVRWVLAAAARVPQLDARTLRDALLGSRLDDAVAGAFLVDARRVLTRSISVQRYEAQGVSLVAMAAP